MSHWTQMIIGNDTFPVELMNKFYYLLPELLQIASYVVSQSSQNTLCEIQIKSQYSSFKQLSLKIKSKPCTLSCRFYLRLTLPPITVLPHLLGFRLAGWLPSCSFFTPNSFSPWITSTIASLILVQMVLCHLNHKLNTAFQRPFLNTQSKVATQSFSVSITQSIYINSSAIFFFI